MKNFFILCLILTFSCNYAQKSEICDNLEKQLSKTISENNFEKSTELFAQIKQDCTKHSEKIYALGEIILFHDLELSNPENVEKPLQDYVSWLQLLNKNFPNNKLGSYQKIALAYYTFSKDKEGVVLENLNKAFTLQPDYFTNSQLLYEYLNLYFEESKKENSKINSFDLINRYIDVVGLSNRNAAKFPEQKAEFARVILNSKQTLSQVLTCENWNNYASTNFENQKDSLIWIENTAKNVYENCKTSEWLETISLQWLQLQPDSKPAYFLGDYYLNKNNQAKAISYFEKSIELANDKTEKAETAYTIAILSRVSNAKFANEKIEFALANNPLLAKYYFFQAELYSNAGANCANTDEKKAALYQLAYQTTQKAAEVDPNSKKIAESKANFYLNAAKKFKINQKKSVSLDCFINKTVNF